MALHLARATVEGVRNRRAFRDVEHFLIFIGYPHSGSTLVGSLLNAHPEAVVSHEANILRYVKPGITRQQLFALVLEGDRRFAAVGRRWMHIDYALPGTHQGTFDHLRVVGDKMAQRASRQIYADPSVLDRLRRIVGVPIRVLYLTRNPFDNIASMASPSMTQRPPKSLSEVVERYRGLADAVDDVRRRLESEELLTLSYESVSADPARRMSEICRFIGVDATESFLETCARAIRPGASRSRDRITWPSEERRAVDELIAAHPTLHRYTFDD
jgi:Sulfotransferase family